MFEVIYVTGIGGEVEEPVDWDSIVGYTEFECEDDLIEWPVHQGERCEIQFVEYEEVPF